jgi:hypothetical protein
MIVRDVATEETVWKTAEIVMPKWATRIRILMGFVPLCMCHINISRPVRIAGRHNKLWLNPSVIATRFGL